MGIFSDYVMWELSIMCTTCTNQTLVLQAFYNHISVLMGKLHLVSYEGNSFSFFHLSAILK
jgi:hypothetical protein